MFKAFKAVKTWKFIYKRLITAQYTSQPHHINSKKLRPTSSERPVEVFVFFDGEVFGRHPSRTQSVFDAHSFFFHSFRKLSFSCYQTWLRPAPPSGMHARQQLLLSSTVKGLTHTSVYFGLFGFRTSLKIYYVSRGLPKTALIGLSHKSCLLYVPTLNISWWTTSSSELSTM